MREIPAAKHLGQHFLKDSAVIDKMVAAIHVQNGQRLLEIGPGLGALTFLVLEKAKQMTVVEFDRRVIDTLKTKAQEIGHLDIHLGNILDYKFSDIVEPPIRVIGNLPYNLSTPILFHCFAQRTEIQDMCFMLQKEVVDRIVAQPGSKIYGRLSIMTQLFCECLPLFDVPPDAFIPPPKVMSSVIRLIPRNDLAWKIDDFASFDRIVRQAFSQRRKMLRKSLRDWFCEEDFNRLSIAATARPETLSGEVFASLANHLYRKESNTR